MRKRLISLGIVLAAALALAPAAHAAPTTFVVNNTGDSADASPGNGFCQTGTGECTLRAAIQESNATASGEPHRIAFSVTQSLAATSLPPITRDGTFVDGCGVGYGDPPFESTPRPPSNNRCVDLVGAGAQNGLQVGDTTRDTSGVSIYNLAFTNFTGKALRIWGADATRVFGNTFGRRVNGTSGPNGVAVNVSGRTQNGSLANAAKGNVIGGPSNAMSDPGAACDAHCNMILGSTVAGIDLVGTPSALNAGDAPAGGSGGADEGTVIAGNWIGVRDAAGTAQANAVAIKLGDSLETTIGGAVLEDCDDQGNCTPNQTKGNVISGNTVGVDQGTGDTSVWMLGGVYGLSPDRDTSVANGQFNARLGGTNVLGGGAFVQGATFGPSAVGLELVGPRAQVIASLFFAPDGSPARFTTAAIRIGPEADLTRIGSNLATPFGCLLALVDFCNTIGSTDPGAPGIWVDGAGDTTIWRNSIGAGLATPVAGPPIRVDGGAVGADIGDNDDDPDRRNNLVRLEGPGVEVGEGATKVMIGGNEGLATTTFNLPSGLFTDLLPGPGPGNSGTVNNGIQAPSITVSSVNGAGGTGIPGARIDLLVQEGPFDPQNLDAIPEGTTYPPTPAVATVAPDGIWGVSFPTPLKQGQKLLAAQTTADGSSEYAAPQAAQNENPPPVVTFQSGPTGVVGERTATFTFSSNEPASRLQCNIDAAGFVPCSSPLTLSDLSIGGHQLQVRATDPTGKQGPPASRTWIVEIPQPLTQAPGPSAKTAAVRFTQVASLPSAKRCISRRTMKITVRSPKGGPKVKTAQARIGGRKAKTRRGAGAITLSLKGLPRGTFVARVKVTLTDGRVVNGTRTYRTCAKKSAKRR